MLNDSVLTIINQSRPQGWVLEPDAKTILAAYGLPAPPRAWARNLDQALLEAATIGYPVAAKVVSPAVIHKSEVQGVTAGLKNDSELSEFYQRVSGLPEFQGILVEGMAEGVELIVGAKIDHQFGPVILLGIGGTSVEIYQDVALRMAPLTEQDVTTMVGELKGSRLLNGYRGAAVIDHAALNTFLLRFSELVMDLAPEMESIDINPLFCSDHGCLAADARIMLSTGPVTIPK